MRKLVFVIGARPNFMKVAPLIREIEDRYTDTFQTVLVHTGQHYDKEMSETFFKDLEIPEPTYNLGVGSATHSVQTARILERFEPLCGREKPDCIVVFGDVNSTLACALVGAKLHIPLAHIEAGLRSFDRSMPEEINRIVTDVLSDFLFTPDSVADRNLLKEGISKGKIFRVGDIMVDTLFWGKKKAETSRIVETLGLSEQAYGVLTLHRAGNVDNAETLSTLVECVVAVAERFPLVFPLHPRTQKRLEAFGLMKKLKIRAIERPTPETTGLFLIKPVGYIDFLRLLIASRFVLTDSGGIQKEATILAIPCLTLRDTTEWPLTVSQGTNRLLGASPNPETVLRTIEDILNGEGDRAVVLPELWDGHTAERILETLDAKL